MVGDCMIRSKSHKNREAEKIRFTEVIWPEELQLLGSEWELSTETAYEHHSFRESDPVAPGAPVALERQRGEKGKLEMQ